jgi:hypothetical protein
VGVSPAFQDRGHLACIPGSRASRLHSRIAGVTSAFQDRGRLACMRLYSTAVERVYISTDFLFAFWQIVAEAYRYIDAKKAIIVTKASIE